MGAAPSRGWIDLEGRRSTRAGAVCRQCRSHGPFRLPVFVRPSAPLLTQANVAFAIETKRCVGWIQVEGVQSKRCEVSGLIDFDECSRVGVDGCTGKGVVRPLANV